MLCLYLALGLSVAAPGCPAHGLAETAPPGPSVALAGRPARDAHSTSPILGKWCSDHQEIWIFGRDYLTHRRPGKSHRHRVRYMVGSDHMTVHVDGYPDVFRWSPDGKRMKLHSSGLDASLRGRLFWRCPDLLSLKDPTI